jgi:hypothetical protein
MTLPYPINTQDQRNSPKTTTEQDWLKHNTCSHCGKGDCRPANHDVNELILSRLRA